MSPKTFPALLQDELLRRIKTNPRYSLRAFARSLETDFSTLAKVMNGKRRAGPKTIAKLGLAPSVIDALQGRAPVAPDRQPPPYAQLALDTFEVIADWHHYAVMELLTVRGFQPDSKWIARALGLSLHEARAAVDRLVRVGLLARDASGWRDLTGGKTTSILPAATAAAARRHQKQVLELGIRAIDEVPLERRDNTSITMSIDPARLPEAREIIKDFRRRLAALLCEDQRLEVYNLCVALYPVSNAQP